MGKPLNHQRFFFAEAEYAEAEVVLWGLPWDCTASFRAGARFGPGALRRSFEACESFSPYFEKDLCEAAIHDAGDMELPFGETDRTLQMVETRAQQFLEHRKRLVSLGGEHLLSLPVIEAYHRVHGEALHVVHIDAHCDLREMYQGNRYSHATVIRRVVERLGAERVSHFFLRSGTREEWEYLRTAPHAHLLRYPFSKERVGDPDLGYLEGRKLYVTLDFDVFDPAMLPGTGVVDTGGILFQDYLQLLHRLGELEVVGCDLMELAPEVDPTGASAVVAAKILRETIVMML